MNKIWIIERSRRSGQLCNRLGLFAHLVAYCIENNDLLINLNLGEYTGGFQNLNSGLVTCFPKKNISIPWNGITYRSWQGISFLLKKSPFSYSLEAEIKPGIISMQDCFNLEQSGLTSQIEQFKFIFCRGWCFRCFNFLAKHSVAVRDFFAFDKQVEYQGSKKSLELRTDSDILVGVHMRLGDYKNHLGGRFYYDPLQYKKIMQATQQIFQNHGRIKFIIFSNEKQYCASFDGFKTYISDGSAVDDLVLMSKCDYILGPPSSFSNWASFYGDTPLYYIKNPDVLPKIEEFQVHLPLDMGV